MKSKTTICIVFLALIATPHYTEAAGLLGGLGNLVSGKLHFRIQPEQNSIGFSTQ